MISVLSCTGSRSCINLTDKDMIQQDRTYIAYKPTMQPTAPAIIKSTGVVMPNAPAKAAALLDGVQVVLKVSNPIYAISAAIKMLPIFSFRTDGIADLAILYAAATTTDTNIATVRINEISDGDKKRQSPAIVENSSQKLFMMFLAAVEKLIIFTAFSSNLSIAVTKRCTFLQTGIPFHCK